MTYYRLIPKFPMWRGMASRGTEHLESLQKVLLLKVCISSHTTRNALRFLSRKKGWGQAVNVLSNHVYTRHTLACSDPFTRTDTGVQASEVDPMYHWYILVVIQECAFGFSSYYCLTAYFFVSPNAFFLLCFSPTILPILTWRSLAMGRRSIYNTLSFMYFLFLCPTQSDSVCYFPNGAVAVGDIPCAPSLSFSPCCGRGWTCLVSGACEHNEHIARGSCTDSSWTSKMCPLFCYGKSIHHYVPQITISLYRLLD